MVTKKRFHNIEELQTIQALACCTSEDVALHSDDGSIMIDAKSFIGLFALDFGKPVLVVSEDLNFHRRIVNVGETLAFMPEVLKDKVYR